MEVKYNEDGMEFMNMDTEYDDDGNIKGIVESWYDEKGNITEKREYNEEMTKIKKRTYYEYDEVDGCKTKKIEVEYDEAGKEIKKVQYRYDEEGNVISETGILYEHGRTDIEKMLNRHLGGERVRERMEYNYGYEYDKAGNAIKKIEYDADGKKIMQTEYDESGKVKGIVEYRYDEDGKIIEEIQYNEDMSKTNKRAFYGYDEYGYKMNKKEFEYDVKCKKNKTNEEFYDTEMILNEKEYEEDDKFEREVVKKHTPEDIAEGITPTEAEIDEVMQETLQEKTVEKEDLNKAVDDE